MEIKNGGNIKNNLHFANFNSNLRQADTSNNPLSSPTPLDSSLLALWPAPAPRWPGTKSTVLQSSWISLQQHPEDSLHCTPCFLDGSHGVSWKLGSSIFNTAKYAFKTALILSLQFLIYRVFWLLLNFKCLKFFKFYLKDYLKYLNNL